MRQTPPPGKDLHEPFSAHSEHEPLKILLETDIEQPKELISDQKCRAEKRDFGFLLRLKFRKRYSVFKHSSLYEVSTA